MSDAEVIERTVTKEKLAKPKKWAVVLHNDDVTPMDFVVELLTVIFRYSIDKAMDLMLQVHSNNRGIAGVYQFEIADQKYNECLTFIALNGFSLKVSLEENEA